LKSSCDLQVVLLLPMQFWAKRSVGYAISCIP
jgi:hypothetical protein